MTDARYHIRFRDDASGEDLGLMLTESPQLGFTRRLINPYAAKTGMGQTKDTDLTEWSMVSWRDWRGGRGQEELEDATAYYDSWNVETRIEGQITLGPLPQNPSGTLPDFEPGSVTLYEVGWPGPEVQTQGSTVYAVYPDLDVGQRFIVRSSNYWIKSVEVQIKKTATTTGAITLSICANTNSLPGTVLASKAVAASSVTTDFTWVTFTLDSPLAITEGYYWICLSTTDAAGYAWAMSMSNPYLPGWVASKLASGSWDSTQQERQFDLTFKVHFSKISRAMSFTTPAGGVTCTSVQLYVSVANAPGTITVALYANSGGAPTGSALASKQVTPSWAMGFYEVTWDSGVALSGATVYHIVVSQETEGTEPPWYDRYFLWGGASAGGYSGGASNRKIDSGSWSGQTEDLYFRVNRDELDGAPVGFARFGGKWYCAAGDTVYEWSDAATAWTVSDHVHGQNVTAIEPWGGYLWAGRGSAGVLRRFNGSSWANVAATYAQLLKAGGGYLHRTNGQANTLHELYYTADGTTWTATAIEVGEGDYPVTGMAWYRDMLVCATAMRLWGIAADMAYPLLEWGTQEDANNGKNLFTWSKTGCLYIPLRFGLYRWNGDAMTAVGPEQGMGLPATRAGYISGMCGTNNWLYVAVNAGSNGTSSILAYNGMGGWHELQRMEKTNQASLALGFETLHSPSRLWFGIGKETRYLMLPDYSDNPYQWTGYEFDAQGYLETSWIGGELLEVVKDLHELVIRGEDLASGQVVRVLYEVDRSGRWTWLGQVTGGPREELAFSSSPFGTRTIGSGSTTTTIELASGHTTEGMMGGDWCRINAEVRQIASITDSNTFVLESALSEAPESGDVVYASRPAGREFRFKVCLRTTDKTKTPKVKAIFVRYQCNVLDQFVYQLSVRVADGMVDLAGNPYPHTAADLRVTLDAWAQRVTPFLLVDPDGREHTVKAVSVGEGGYERVEGALPARYTSVYSINLVEVV